jgi:hypothetical protein
MTLSSKAWFFVLLVPVLILISWIAYHELRTPQNQEEVLTRMIELQKQGRYDGAVRVMQRWMNDSRRDVTHDELLYQQIAMIYIMKAYKKSASRNESARLAELSLEKSFDLFERQKSKDNDPWLIEIGGAYETLGDISDRDKCRLYERANALYLEQLPLIKGESLTSYGYTARLEPVRAEIRKHLDATKKKLSGAGCPVALEDR